MADVTCQLTFEEWEVLVSETSTLPAELQQVLKDAKRTTKLAHGYAMELTEGEAQSLLAHAASHDLGVAAALREELAGHERRKREEKP